MGAVGGKPGDLELIYWTATCGDHLNVPEPQRLIMTGCFNIGGLTDTKSSRAPVGPVDYTTWAQTAIFLSCIRPVVVMVSRNMKILLFTSLIAALALPGMYFGGITTHDCSHLRVVCRFTATRNWLSTARWSCMGHSWTAVLTWSGMLAGNVAVTSVYTVWSLPAK